MRGSSPLKGRRDTDSEKEKKKRFLLWVGPQGEGGGEEKKGEEPKLPGERERGVSYCPFEGEERDHPSIRGDICRKRRGRERRYIGKRGGGGSSPWKKRRGVFFNEPGRAKNFLSFPSRKGKMRSQPGGRKKIRPFYPGGGFTSGWSEKEGGKKEEGEKKS